MIEANMNETVQLLKLAGSQDKPLNTSELHPQNDYYGHAATLKRFLKLPKSYSIKGVIEHGARIRHRLWNVEMDTPLPAYFVFSPYRAGLVCQETNKSVFTLGPMIKYAPSSKESPRYLETKKKIGRNITLFPTHSTHWIDHNYNIEEFYKQVASLPLEFDTITCCVYWKDILRGHHTVYQKLGCRIVTAGHMYDAHFLSRLRQIIEASDYTVSNIFSTASVYSIALGIPHCLIDQDLSYKSYADVPPPIFNPSEKEFYQVESHFKEPVKEITSKQLEVAKHYFGTEETKSREELRLILNCIEDMYSRGPQYYLKSKTLLPDYINLCLDEGRVQEAAYLFSLEQALYPQSPARMYVAARLAKEQGDRVGALRSLKAFLAAHPQDRDGLNLLRELSG
jgi:hypothetical protein